MKASTKVILSVILLPSVVAAGYGGYVYWYEKPRTIKKILELLKKRFEQNKKNDTFTTLDWELLLKKIDPNILKKMKRALQIAVAYNESTTEAAVSDYKNLIEKLKKSLNENEILILLKKNNLLPEKL